MSGGTPAASSSLRTSLSYYVRQVRAYDYHHYLCLLHLAPAVRKAAFTFRTFNIETARAMDVVFDPRAGLMRLLWWKEGVDKIFGNKLVEHPVAQALSSIIADHKVSKHWLKRSVEARINDANREEGTIPRTSAKLERYVEDTQSTILYMTLQAGGIQSTVADHAASHIGKASGLLLLLKALPHHVNNQGTVHYIPASVAEECGLLITREGGRSEVRAGERLLDVVFKVASVAEAHLHKARELAPSVPKEAIPMLLPALPAQVLLDTLRR
ncbi:NADH dehydrogenase (ubiquinone) complex I, assembly factor 6 [Zea mays]|jgi:NADH dehydrogenase [ubiquinone] 1 alpha subcomplex assembly factor 6|uniref:Terpenoid synthases superfamily protein n=2 Tax=Zea mays TaxID=4577 RepID=B4FPS7_MAIZE|nr:unknown [Zea mays]ACN33316.1 unknown [Zea mays]ACN35587.1 unknown [Zea mays]AQK79833.1 Terpenoid synthases superfamily protein [Zea mays]PWZ17846.1 NADH dehydrogenase (ubiquinone) complex I, assembly factor 6 [Zea mays]